MTKKIEHSILPLLALAAAVGLLAAPATAFASDQPDSGSFTGSFDLGVRTVSVSGTETKFREDINLEEGPRLFGLSFKFLPARGENGEAPVVDRVQLNLSNFGGDPFETMSLSAARFGKWDLKYNRTVSEYFYADTILPIELSTPSLGNAGDFHHFDFERVRDTGDLSIRLNEAAKINFGFERFTKKGETTTTLDISRDEFELDRPIEESLNAYNVGFEYAWDKATLILQERVSDYDNAFDTFLPGLSLGEDPEDATILDFFFFDQTYEIEGSEHIVRLNARPRERLDIRFSAISQSLDLDAHAEEEGQGIAFNGAPFNSEASGSGEIDRDVDFYGVEISYRVSDRVALVGEFRQHELDQEGLFPYGEEVNEGTWDIETTGYEVGVQIQANHEVTLAFGLREEERDVAAGHGAGEDLHREKTDHSGWYAEAHWRPSKDVRLDAVVEDSSFDDPFTLSSPTDRSSVSLRGRFGFDNGAYLSAGYRLREIENSNSGWDADTDQINVRLGYRKEGVDCSVGATFADTDRKVNQVVTTAPGFGGGIVFTFPIDYMSESDFIDGRFRWAANDRVTLGADVRFYENSGSFPIDRDDLRGYTEIGLGQGYVLHLGYRTVDYSEGFAAFDDYDADIGELSIGYRW